MFSLLINDINVPIESLFTFDARKNRLLLDKQFNYEYLTKRELDVMKYIMLGYTAKKIAVVLQLSYRTVEAYIVTLKLKLRCSTKGELIETSVRIGLFRYFYSEK